MDEAGRGPWAGPVVAAAVILKRPHLPIRIDDSKRLTPRQRAAAYDVILRHADVGVGVVCAQAIDQLNILQASLQAMQQAVADLGALPDLALVDGPLAPTLSMPAWPLVRGDQRSYVIACASIVAKVVRDRAMVFYHTLAPAYGFHQHKGYGTAAHAQRLVAAGPCLFHRASFQPVRRMASQGVAEPAAIVGAALRTESSRASPAPQRAQSDELENTAA